MFQSLMKKIYGKFNGKLFPIVTKPMSWLTLFFLLIYKKKNQKIILLGSAIGDVLYTFSFLNSFSNSINSEIVLVGSDRFKEMFESYNVKALKAIFLPHCGVLQLLELALACNCNNFKKSLVSKIAYDHNICPGIPGACYWLDGLGVVGNRNILSNLYGVPVDPISYHRIKKKKVSVIPGFDSDKRKICVVNPYSFSMKTPIEKFEKICTMLRDQGFLVYTNVVGTQQPVVGTSPLNCDLQELFSIASEIPLIVSIRSGILDFLVPSNVNMFAIYVKKDAEDELIAKHYSLQEWKPKGLVEEVYFDGEIDEDILSSRFQSYLERLNLEI